MNDFWLLIELGFFHVWDCRVMTICFFSLRFVCPFPQDSGNPCCGSSLALQSGTVCPHPRFAQSGVSSIWIEFLIPVSIAATAVYNIIYAKAVWVRNNQS